MAGLFDDLIPTGQSAAPRAPAPEPGPAPVESKGPGIFDDLIPDGADWGKVMGAVPGKLGVFGQQVIAGTIRDQVEQIHRRTGGTDLTSQMLAERQKVDDELAAKSRALDVPGMSTFQKGVQGAAVSVPISLASGAAGMAFGDPALGLLPLYYSTQGQKLSELSAGEGGKLPYATRKAHAQVQGATEALTEALPFAKYLEATPWGTKLLGAMVAELPGESIAQIIQGSSDYIAEQQKQGHALTPEMALEALRKSSSELPETWIATALGTGAQASAFSAVQNAQEAYNPTFTGAVPDANRAQGAPLAPAGQATAPAPTAANPFADLISAGVRAATAPPPPPPPTVAPPGDAVAPDPANLGAAPAPAPGSAPVTNADRSAFTQLLGDVTDDNQGEPDPAQGLHPELQAQDDTGHMAVAEAMDALAAGQSLTELGYDEEGEQAMMQHLFDQGLIDESGELTEQAHQELQDPLPPPTAPEQQAPAAAAAAPELTYDVQDGDVRLKLKDEKNRHYERALSNDSRRELVNQREDAEAHEATYTAQIKAIQDAVSPGTHLEVPHLKGRYAIAPIKGWDRIVEKLVGDGAAKDPTKVGGLKDMLRSTIAVRTPAEAQAALDQVLAKLGQAKGTKIKKGLLEGADPWGYADIKVNVPGPNGRVYEVQINTPAMMTAKEGRGHKIYEEARSITDRAVAEGRMTTPEENAELERLQKESVEFYRPFVEAFGAGVPSRSTYTADTGLTRQPPEVRSTQLKPGLSSQKDRPSNSNGRQPGPGVQEEGMKEGSTAGSLAQAEPSEARPPQVRDGTPGPIAKGRKDVIFVGDQEIEVRREVVEAGNLISSEDERFPPSLQPRQRGLRAVLTEQVRKISLTLNPRRFKPPVTREDGVVLSGNGRTMAVRQMYERGGAVADAYRQHLVDQGYDIKGFKEPIERLVPTEKIEDERAFAIDANRPTTAAMSAAEQALADVGLLTPRVLAKLDTAYSIGSSQNREFATAFLSGVPVAERGGLQGSTSGLSQAGVRRIEAALLAKAYGGSPTANDLLNRVLEDTSDNTKAITGAMLDAAPEMAQLRDSIAEGRVDKKLDLAKPLVEALQKLAAIRENNKSLTVELENGDMFGRDPVVDEFLRSFYQPGFKRARSRAHLGEFLTYLAKQAQEQGQQGMFGAMTDAHGLVKQARDLLLENRRGDLASSRAPGQSRRMGVADVQRRLESLLKRLAPGVRKNVHIVDNPGQLPTEALQQIGADSEAFVNFETGEIYLIASNMNPARVRQVFVHELIGHLGLYKILGRSKFDALLHSVKKARNTDPTIAASWKEAEERYPGETRDTLAAETLAITAEKEPTHNLVQRAFAAIRHWVRYGLELDIELTQNDMIYMLQRSADAMLKKENAKKAATRNNGDTAYMPPGSPSGTHTRFYEPKIGGYDLNNGFDAPQRVFQSRPGEPASLSKAEQKEWDKTRPVPKELPEDPSRYFLLEGSTSVKLTDLVSGKTAEETARSGATAATRMRGAYDGELARRPPITVRRRPDGKYDVLDGNSTTAAANQYGWKSLPVMVEESQAPPLVDRETEKKTEVAGFKLEQPARAPLSQTDMFGGGGQQKAAPKPKPKNHTTTGDLFASRSTIPHVVAVTFPSGMTRPEHIAVAAKARSPVGVDLREVSKPVMGYLKRVLQNNLPLFVDSGAFGLRNKTNADGSRKRIDPKKTVDAYKELSQSYGGDGELLSVVAPDSVGEAGITVGMIRSVRDELYELMAEGHRVILPVHSVESAARIGKILDKAPLTPVWGIPSNAAAMSDQDFRRFLREQRPARLHILGAASQRSANDRLDAIRDVLENDEVEISLDANLITSKRKLWNGQDQAKRIDIFTDVLKDVNSRRQQVAAENFDRGEDAGLRPRKDQAPAQRTMFASAPPVQSKEFKDWFGDSQVRDYNGEPQVVYHGTTHEFDTFDAKKANPENFYGRTNYFTTEAQDVNKNYSSTSGPDITNRIERRVEELTDEEDKRFDYNSPEQKAWLAEARERARRELGGPHEGLVMPAYLRVEKPIVIAKGMQGTQIDFYGGTQKPNYDGDGEVDGSKIWNALKRVVDRTDALDLGVNGNTLDQPGYSRGQQLVGEFRQQFEGMTVSSWDVDRYLRDKIFPYAKNGDYDAIITGDLVRQVWEAAGFDGIRLNAHDAFRTMVQEDTWHWHVSKPTQVKSALGNSGKFSKRNPSILAARAPGASPQARELHKQFIGQNDKFWGVVDDEEGAKFANGYSVVQCTGFAFTIRDKLGAQRVKVRGFQVEDNPSAIRLGQVADGHDFAVVDGRYIVDPWVTEVEAIADKGVHDLEDPADAAAIRELYGDPDKWVKVDPNEQTHDDRVFASRLAPAGTPKVNVGGGTYTQAPNLGVTKEAQQAILDVMQIDGGKRIAEQRGNDGQPITWDMTGDNATELLEGKFGSTFQSLVNRVPRSTANAAKLEAYARIVNAGGETLRKAADQYALTGSAQDLVRLEAAREQLGVALAPFMGYRSEAGRSLQILRKVQADFADAQAIFEALGDGKEQAMREFARRIKGAGSVAEALKLTMGTYKPTVLDMLREYYLNSWLSGPWTHLVNMTSNTGYSVLETGTELGASLVSPNISTRAAWARFTSTIAGMRLGLANAGKAFVKDEPVLNPQTQIENERRRAIPGIAGKVIRIPGRALMAEDEFAKAIAYTGELHRLAMEEAQRQNPQNPGAVFDSILQAYGNDKAIQKAAREHADRLTFQQPLGTLGKSLMRLREDSRIGWLLAPFVKTPTNILKAFGAYSPLAPAMPSVRAQFKESPRQRDLAIARMTVGATMMGTVAMLVLQGAMTGAGPDDDKERDLWTRLGKKPYAINPSAIARGGKSMPGDTWYKYNRFDPIGMVLGVAADATELAKAAGSGELSKVGTMLATSIMLNLADKTYLRGVMDFAQAVNEPKRYMAQWASGMANAIVPNIFAQAARVVDPNVREARGAVDQLKARVPGLRETLPVKVDIAGQPIKSSKFEPVAESKQIDDPLAQTMLDLGVFLGAPSRKLTFKGHELELDSAQYTDLKTYTQQARWDKLGGLVQAPGFQSLIERDPQRAAAVLRKKYTGIGEDAKLRWLRQHPDLFAQLRNTERKAAVPSNYAQ